MKITCLSVGKQHSADLAGYIQDFEKRLMHQISWEFITPSGHASAEQARTLESETLLNKLKQTDTVVLLDERGRMPDNHQLAAEFERWTSAHGRLVIIIGGAFGVSDALRSRANYVWSLSPLVLPHQLVRAVLVEQLYRTQAILQQHPYHHQ